MNNIFDTHAHYFREDFGDELESVLSSLPKNGVERVMAVGCSLSASYEQLQLARKYDYIWAAVGIHPEDCENLPEDWLLKIREMLGDEKAVAVGEIGLDYHYENAPAKQLQKEVFVRQLTLARELDLPVIIHSRDACEDTLEILREYTPRGVMHCYSYSPETAKEIVKLGMYIGFTGVLTFKNAKKAVKACEEIPLDRLLLETDCPYMAPEPFRGKRCDSSMIKYTAEKMAEIKGVSTEEIISITNKNGKKLFFK